MTPHPLASEPDRADQTSAQPSDETDLVFIGAGVSCSYTLLGVLRRLHERPAARPVRLAVIERTADPFGGLPYGSRAGRTSLIITSLRDFLPEPERTTFSTWLAANKAWVFDEFRAAAGPLSEQWWARHVAEIERDEFDALFLPRYVFGLHIAERVEQAITAAEAAGVATTRVIHDDVTSIEPAPVGYLVRGATTTLPARRIALTLGTPPTLTRLGDRPTPAGVTLIDDPFEPGIADALERVRAALEQPGAPATPAHVVLVGGNASTMELLYQLNDLDTPRLRDATFTIVSLRGELPERLVEPDPDASFTPTHIDALAEDASVSAVAIFDAAVADIGRGRAAGLTISDTLAPISKAVGALVRRLSPDEAADFAGRWGMELGRHQRRAGWEYCDVVDELTATGRLRRVAGAFTGVDVTPAGTALVQYEHDGRPAVLDPAADVVVNCGGFARLVEVAEPSLLRQIFASGPCRTTRWDRGIAVDDTMAAAPGIYVMGPLLAGNVINGGPLWHMEHCGRVSTYGSALGVQLAERLVTDEP